MPQQQIPVRGFLESVDLNPPLRVNFQYNPTQITDKKTVNYASLSAPGRLSPIRQYTHGGDRTLTFTIRIDGQFDGPADRVIGIDKDADGSIVPELNKYRAFLYPKHEQWSSARASFLTLFDESQQFASPPTCLFGLSDRVIECIVTDISITELLFTPTMAPLRADVGVTLVELTTSLDS